MRHVSMEALRNFTNVPVDRQIQAQIRVKIRYTSIYEQRSTFARRTVEKVGRYKMLALDKAISCVFGGLFTWVYVDLCGYTWIYAFSFT
jgi:hypothetical protein